jgi:hypothetical protein
LYLCVFILITHFVSDTLIEYTQKKFKQNIIQPVIQLGDIQLR